MADLTDLILYNANVWTLDPGNPQAEAVAIAGDKISAVGSNREVLSFSATGTEVIDCRGLPLVPGLNDAHCHILATAASISGVDCTPGNVASIAQLLSSVRRRASALTPGQWIRGHGLEPEALQENRYPTRLELDSAAPDHPVRLEHSNGHATVLNSPALQLATIDSSTPDPMEGLIDRESATGEPTGLLLEMGSFLRRKLGNTRSNEDLESGVSGLGDKLLKYGITSVQDAGPHNGIGQWQTFESLVGKSKFGPRITMMAGVEKLNEFTAAGLGWASGGDKVRLGHAKVMLTTTTGSLYPAREDLRLLAFHALKTGFPFAVHAVEREALVAVLDLPELGMTPSRDPEKRAQSPVPRNRIEHCAECPPQLMDRLARSGATVVTQPGFVYWRGDGYLQRVDRDLLPYLYDSGEVNRRNIPLAFGSDAPVIDPSPWPGIYSAITSRTSSGNRLPRTSMGREAGKEINKDLTMVQALGAYTIGGAWAEGNETRKGIIRPGMLADLAVLDTPLSDECLKEIKGVRAKMTIVGGKIMWVGGLG